MKKLILILGLLLFNNYLFSQSNNDNKNTGKSDIVVYYFHATHRCPTCLSIEANTKKTLDTYFKNELNSGKIKLIILNVDEDKNKAIAEKYAAYGSALFITLIKDGKETQTDMTNFAFQNSLNKPDKFVEGLKKEINKNLK